MQNAKLLWLDLEMTGLDEKTHKILELAAIATDFNFEPVAEFHKIVHQSEEELNKMDEWCTKTHTSSGLIEKVRTQGIALDLVEKELCDFLVKNFSTKDLDDRIVLAGNSIWNDRKFIDLYMPKFSEMLHYRMVDVSSFKVILKNKFKIKFEKKNTHKALDDILESIEELKHYLMFFKNS